MRTRPTSTSSSPAATRFRRDDRLERRQARPQPPLRTRSTTADIIGGAATTPTGVAVDQANGDIYVLETRHRQRSLASTPAGAAQNFTAGAGQRATTDHGVELAPNSAMAPGRGRQLGQSRSNGYDLRHRRPRQRRQVDIFGRRVLGTPQRDRPADRLFGRLRRRGRPGNGDVYVGDYASGDDRRYAPTGGAPVTTPTTRDGVNIGRSTPASCAVAVSARQRLHAPVRTRPGAQSTSSRSSRRRRRNRKRPSGPTARPA